MEPLLIEHVGEPGFLQTYLGKHGSGPTPSLYVKGKRPASVPHGVQGQSPQLQILVVAVSQVPCGLRHVLCPLWASSHDTQGWAKRPWGILFDTGLLWLPTPDWIHPFLLFLPHSDLTPTTATPPGPRRVSIWRTCAVESCSVEVEVRFSVRA